MLPDTRTGHTLLLPLGLILFSHSSLLFPVDLAEKLREMKLFRSIIGRAQARKVLLCSRPRVLSSLSRCLREKSSSFRRPTLILKTSWTVGWLALMNHKESWGNGSPCKELVVFAVCPVGLELKILEHN